MALRENAALQAQQGQLVCLAVQVPRALLDQLEKKVLLERRVLKALQVEMESKALWVFLGLRVLLALLVRMETRVKLENQVKKAAKVTKVKMALLVRQGFKDLLVPLELLEEMVRQVPEDSRGCLDKRVMKVHEVSQDHLDP